MSDAKSGIRENIFVLPGFEKTRTWRSSPIALYIKLISHLSFQPQIRVLCCRLRLSPPPFPCILIYRLCEMETRATKRRAETTAQKQSQKKQRVVLAELPNLSNAVVLVNSNLGLES